MSVVVDHPDGATAIGWENRAGTKMVLNETQISELASRLIKAEDTCQQIGLPSELHPDMGMDDAYAVQKAILGHKLARGRKVLGWKIGLTSRAMQQALNIDIPDSGVLFDDMAFENDCIVPAGRFIQPRVEAEIAFVMKSPLTGDNITRQDVIEATDYVAPSLEILDTRVLRVSADTGNSRTVLDTISDNAANAGIVLGDKTHDVSAFDLRWVGAIVSRDGEVEETGLGAGVLNDPVAGIVWLTRRMSQYGQDIRAGDVILSGSFIRPLETTHGTVIEADYGDFGTVKCTFE